MTKNIILIASGGTGGHIFPAYSLANYLIKNNFNQIRVFKDLSRKDRCIVSTKAN